MKKIISFLIIVLAALLMFSCETPTTEVKPSYDNTPEYYDITYSKLFNKELEDYYVEEAIALDFFEELELYARDENASDEYKNLFHESDARYLLPIYGRYLEYTSLAVCAFEKEGALIGTVALQAVENNGLIEITEVKNFLKHADKSGTVSDRMCYDALKRHWKSSELDLLGVMYDMCVLQIYPVALDKQSNAIKRIYVTQRQSIAPVKDFATIEEGHKLFEAHFAKRAETLKSLPFYSWTTRSFGVMNGLSKYINSDVPNGEKYDYLDDRNNSISIPLLDENGNEGIYSLHLIYCYDQLIAELVLTDENGRQVAVYEKIATKDASTGEYIPLEGIYYAEAANRLIEENSSRGQIKGIGFNGTDYVIVFE